MFLKSASSAASLVFYLPFSGPNMKSGVHIEEKWKSLEGVDTKQQTTKKQTYKTAKSQNSEKQNGETKQIIAIITKQQTLQNSKHNITAIITK